MFISTPGIEKLSPAPRPRHAAEEEGGESFALALAVAQETPPVPRDAPPAPREGLDLSHQSAGGALSPMAGFAGKPETGLQSFAPPAGEQGIVATGEETPRSLSAQVGTSEAEAVFPGAPGDGTTTVGFKAPAALPAFGDTGAPAARTPLPTDHLKGAEPILPAATAVPAGEARITPQAQPSVLPPAVATATAQAQAVSAQPAPISEEGSPAPAPSTGEAATASVAPSFSLAQPSAPAAPSQAQAPAALPLPPRLEEHVLAQVTGRISLLPRQEGGRVTLRLYPEELGEVQLDLRVEKDGVRAFLQTQTVQAQEVLERHIPRLREALEQQGLRLDELQVSLDFQGRKGGGSQDQPAPFAPRSAARFAAAVQVVKSGEEALRPHPTGWSARGLSLHI